MQGAPHAAQGEWWMAIPYFMLISFSLLISYPFCWMVGLAVKRNFPYGDIVKEAPAILLAALFDTIVTALPVFLGGMPAWYFLLGVVPGTALIGIVYHRLHLNEWHWFLPYLFALASRLMLLLLALAFMWNIGFFNR